MISLPMLAVAALVNYRVARMIALEEGPFGIFAKVRALLGGELQQHWLGRGVNCPLCIGFWTALLVEILILGYFEVWSWLAVAGLQTVLQEMET